MTSHFRRGKSKVYYNSDIWDPGSGVSDLISKPSESEEDLARTSFRSSRDESSGAENPLSSDISSNNDGNGYVASLLRRQREREILFGHSEDIKTSQNSSTNAINKDRLDSNCTNKSNPQQFTSIPPPVIKPSNQYQQGNSISSGYQGIQSVNAMSNRHSVLNHSVELDDILEESDCLDDEDIEGSSSTGTGGESRASPQNATCSSSSPDVSSSGGNPSPEGSFRGMLPPIIKRIGVNGLVNKYNQHNRRSRGTLDSSSNSSKNISWCFEDADSAIVMERISSYPAENLGSTKILTNGTEIEIKDMCSPNGRHYKQHRIHSSSKANQHGKSHDSGFSDSADSTEDQKSNDSSKPPKIKASSNMSPSSSSSISSNASNTSSNDDIHIVSNMSRHQSQHNDYSLTNSSEEETEHSNRVNDITTNCANSSNGVCSEVVHETRTNAYEPHKQYHVSKVYFYSVSDMILNGEGAAEEVEGIRSNEVESNTLKEYFHGESYTRFAGDTLDCGESYVDTDFNDEIEFGEQHVSILDCETGQPLQPKKDSRRHANRKLSKQNLSLERFVEDEISNTKRAASSRDVNNGSSLCQPPPPPPQRISSLSNKDESFDTSYDSIPMVKLDPNACDMILSDNEQLPFLDVSHNSASPGPSGYYFMEHKPIRPLEFKSVTNTTDEKSYLLNRETSPMSSYYPEASDAHQSDNPKYMNGPVSKPYARTASLGRTVKTSPTSPPSLSNNSINPNHSLSTSSSSIITSPNGRPLSSSRTMHGGSGFPKTNGALLYESLSLGRPSSRGITETKRGGLSTYSTLHDYHVHRSNSTSNGHQQASIHHSTAMQNHSEESFNTTLASVSLPSPAATSGWNSSVSSEYGPNSTMSPDAAIPSYDSFDDPISGSRLPSIRSYNNSDEDNSVINSTAFSHLNVAGSRRSIDFQSPLHHSSSNLNDSSRLTNASVKQIASYNNKNITVPQQASPYASSSLVASYRSSISFSLPATCNTLKRILGEDHLVSFGEPVLFWLRELSLVHEAECTIMLQSKPVDPGNFAKRATSFTSERSFVELAQLETNKTEKMDTGEDDIESYSVSNYGSKDNCHQPHQRHQTISRDSEERCSLNETDDALCSEASYMWTGTSKDTIRAIQTRAHSISAVFAKLCKQLGYRNSTKLVPLVQELGQQIHLFLAEYNRYNSDSTSNSNPQNNATMCDNVEGNNDSDTMRSINLPGFRRRSKTKRNESILNGHESGIDEKSSTNPGLWNNNSSSSTFPNEDVLHQQRLLLQSCDRLKLSVSRHMMFRTVATTVANNASGSIAGSESAIVDIVTQLGATFTKLIELMLSKEIKSSVERLNERKSSVVLKLSIDQLINLALEGNHLCRLIAKHGGVRSLLQICCDEDLRNVRVNAFRALGTICCVLEGIMELQECGGVELLARTLANSEDNLINDDNATNDTPGVDLKCNNEVATAEEKSEAAGLLAQVTSPWIENNCSIEGLSRHLDNLVSSLTVLCENTSSAETFLLASAALANLTFMEPSAVHAMQRHETVRVLVSAILESDELNDHALPSGSSTMSEGKGYMAASIYIQDQVAAVLANMAANEETRNDVVEHSGLSVLLKFLQCATPLTNRKINNNNENTENSTEEQNGVYSNPTRPEDFAQVSAAERVLQKSAIAISRLCNDPQLAEEVVQLQGLRRLVELCKCESARVASDGVLVACLAAVRKISAAVGTTAFEEMDAAELVEPRLLDSFLIFSSRNESFV